MFRSLVFLFGAILMISACKASGNTGPNIHVENAWARPALPTGAIISPRETTDTSIMNGMAETGTPIIQGMPGMSGSAVYFVIVNDGGEADTLTGATTVVASQVSLHQTQMNGDIAKMVPLVSLDIPADGKVEFKPGGYHVMLEGLKQDLREGETFKISLIFKKSGSITIDVPVRQQR
jgi:copper(I)-binding protein